MTSNSITFFINGKQHHLEEGNVDPRMTLIQYLRGNGLTGTKLGCGEGGCGACTVMLSKYDHDSKAVKHVSANACLTPLCGLDGLAITTIEGIGGMKNGLHPVQRRVATMHGSQCGFCTPGIVMAIYTQLRMKPDSTPHEIEESMDGNLCRCTGYRPILDAARSLSNNKGGCCGGGGAGGGCPCKEAEEKPSCCDSKKDCCGKEGGSSSGCCESKSGKSFSNTEKVLASTPSLAEEMAERNLTEPIFPPFLMRYETKDVTLKGSMATWHQPLTMPSLLSLKEAYPNARLIVGNTEVGIEVKFKNLEYPVLINPSHVKELQVLNFSEVEGQAGLEVGGAVSITRLRDYIEEIATKLEKSNKAYVSRGYVAIRHMLTWFASNHIRNVACVGGNIVTASPISDLNPMLLACGAILKLTSLKGSRLVPMSSFFLGYRKVDLKPDEVLESVFIPATQSNEYVIPFKQARRREDDISIVTSGMKFAFAKAADNSWVVQDCSLAFGGMAPTTVLAPKTAAALIGKPWTFNTMEEIFPVLREEFSLPENVPGGQAEFRMSLTMSFLMKAYLTLSSELDEALQTAIPEKERSGAVNFVTAEKPSTRAEQEYTLRQGGIQHARPVPHSDNDEENNGIVGKSLMHKSAESQVSGEAKYTWDTAMPANTAHACLVTSTRAHAKVLNVDLSVAQASPAFIAYFSAKDVVGSNIMGAIVKDEEVFCTEEVKHVGAVIGVILATSHEEAMALARKVKIDYQDLPALISIEDAIANNSFFADHHEIRSGDVSAGQQDSDFHVTGTCRMGGQEHFYLETNTSFAFPSDNGFIEVTSSTQNCTETQKFCASVCGLPLSKVNVKCKRMGGGFGGKESRSVFIACTAALSAHLLGRPVSINIERDVDMSITGQRHAFIVKYKAGCKKDGTLTYMDAELFNNAGFSMDLSGSIMDRALFHSDNVYRWAALRVRGNLCKTNQPTHTAYRGFGGPQGMLFTETVMHHLSAVSGIEVHALRQRNLYSEGDVTHFGQPLEDFYVPRLWKDLNRIAEVEQRQQNIAQFNQQNRWRKRGLCVLPTKFGINFTAKFLNQGGALVHVYHDGSVLIAHGGTEMGQGLYTKMIQVAAQCFGIPDTKVFISETATNTVPNSSPSAASLSTDLYGMAVLDACEQILERLKPVRASLPADTEWNALIGKAYFDRINLSAQGFYTLHPDRCGYDFNLITDDNAKRGRPFNYFTQGVACSEVEIDCLTGDSKVIRTDILMDVGKSINPAIDIGQIEGAFIQGYGWCTMEELVWGDKDHPWVREGQLFTRGPGTYKIPAFNDVPLDFRVHLSDTDNRFAVHSSKAIGEPPFFLGASVFFAIKSAIDEARKENGLDGFYALDSPATSERIRMACGDAISKLCVKNAAADFHPKGSW